MLFRSQKKGILQKKSKKRNGFNSGREHDIIPKKENWFLDIPLTTIKFFLDVLKEDVFKTYIYLGQKWNWSHRVGEGMPIFTKGELLEHIGLKKNQFTLQFINNVLVVLKDIGVIDYREFHQGKVPQMRLIAFDLFVKNLNDFTIVLEKSNHEIN